jgi:protein arginine N-methyltransferase 1
MTYGVGDYGRMMGDHRRVDAYLEALRRVIGPGSVVADIGTGTGILALLACRLGARRVYAVDPSEAIEVARRTAAASGYSRRIGLIRDVSTNVELPETADVIVSDLRGVLPLHGRHIPSIVDARERLLSPGGILIPQRDRLWVGVVETEDLYRRHVAPWGESTYELDMSAARGVLTNTWTAGRLSRESLLVEPEIWTTLDYRTVESPDVQGSLCWTIRSSAVGHGLGIWFDTTLVDGVGFSTAPGRPELIYGTAFFPFSEPLRLGAGDRVSVRLHADLVGDDYVWRWATEVSNSHGVKASFEQSTFFGMLSSPSSLRRRHAACVPSLTDEGLIDRLVLERMAVGRPLGDIAREVSSRFPGRFPDWRSALDHVGRLAEKYSR